MKSLIDYVNACEGTDILQFPTSDTATEAARKLREHADGKVEVFASYNRVELRAKAAARPKVYKIEKVTTR
jgi:hypothetical protein